jgi:hypothetical protein
MRAGIFSREAWTWEGGLCLNSDAHVMQEQCANAFSGGDESAIQYRLEQLASAPRLRAFDALRARSPFLFIPSS